MEISVVIPVFNSETSLEELYDSITRALRGVDHEVIFVNDGSSDGSWKMIEMLVQDNPNVTGVCFRKNFGQDNAILEGMRHSSGEFVVVMDDDLQQDPEDIPLLYETCKNGDFDVCYGKFSLRYHSRWKRAGSAVNGRIARWFLKKPRNLYLSPFKIITREVVQEIIRYEGPYPYIDGLLLQLTAAVTQTDVRCRPRRKGRSGYSFFRSVSLFLRHSTSFSVIPIRIATLTGFVLSLAGFGLALYYLYEYFFTEHIVEGWTSLIVSLLLLGGLILMTLGLIGEYIGRSFLTINHKPQGSVRKVITKKDRHDTV